MNNLNIADVANQMIPLTYFRRNAGVVFDKLSTIGQFIILRDGLPIATLNSISSAIDWDDFMEKVRISRSFKGKRGNLSAMIAKDRQNH
ncbi:MAG: hypothetical protein AAB550_02000 [Patescibacteria group bacterium]